MWVFLCVIKHRNSNERHCYLGGERLTLWLIALGSASANKVQSSYSGMALWRGNRGEKREKQEETT